MKKLFFILIILFSCDDLGVQEFEESFSYYDFLSYGWSKVFENDLEEAISYFNESLNVDVSYYNSAMVGMGWVMTYSANNIINSDECENENDCTNDVDILRTQAKCFYYRSTLEDQEELKSKKFDEILSWCENENIEEAYDILEIMSLDLSDIVDFYKEECEADESGQFEYTNCYEDFILDLKVGHLYLKYLSYQTGLMNGNIVNDLQVCLDDIDENENYVNNNTCDEIDKLLKLFEDFWKSNQSYDITGDKAVYNDTYDINHTKLEARIAQLYIDSGMVDKISKSCEYAKKVCTSSNFDCQTENQFENILNILDCIDSDL